MKKYFFAVGLVLSWLMLFGHVLAFELELDLAENIALTKVKPVLVKKKGASVGGMVVEVSIKNTGNKSAQFIVFASGKIEGGWAGGRVILPKKGELQPQEIIKGKIKTKYKGKELPSVLRIEGSEKLF